MLAVGLLYLLPTALGVASLPPSAPSMYMSIFYISLETRTHTGDNVLIFHPASIPLCICGGTEKPRVLPTAAILGHLPPDTQPAIVSSLAPLNPSCRCFWGGKLSLLFPQNHLSCARWRGGLCPPLFSFKLLLLPSPLFPAAHLGCQTLNSFSLPWMRGGSRPWGG